MIDFEPQYVLGRPRLHVVGNTQRVVHLFELPKGKVVDGKITALCGASFGPGQLERVDDITGMPCEPCLACTPQEEREPS